MLYLTVALTVMGVIFYIVKVAFWWFPELKTMIMPHSDNKDQDIRLSFSLFFVLISFMLILDLELVLGAFIVGLFINAFFGHKKELPEKLSSFGFGFLVPLFFIHIGSTLDLEMLFVWEIFRTALLITLVMILIRLFSASVFFQFLGLKGVFLFALSQSMPLTLMVAVATLAFHASSIDTIHYYAFILASILEVVLILLTIKLVALIPEKSKTGR
jgi:Kef-type K+ transport system membrane component KefB